MSWIKSFQELRDHPKTKRAARLLGIKKMLLIGHLHGLWWWAASYAEDGSLAGYGAEDIAEAAEWDGDPLDFVEALLNCGVNGNAGFLERDESGNLLIHDWYEYAGKLAERRATERDRQRNKRATECLPSKDVAPTEEKQPADVGATLEQQPASVASLARAREAEAEAEERQKRSRAESSARRIAPADVPDKFKPFDAILRAFDGYDPSQNFFDTIDERYSHLPLKEEAVKATEWLRANKKRKCTTIYMLKWLSSAAQGYAARTPPSNGQRPDSPQRQGEWHKHYDTI